MSEELSSNKILSKVLLAFIVSLLFASIGVYVGQFVPPALFIPLIIFELLLLIVVLFMRKKKAIGYVFLYFFTFLTGVTSYVLISHYISELGGHIVLMVLLSTILIFSILGCIGYVTKKNLMSWGGALLSALLALIIVSIINIFFPLGSAGSFVITIAGIIIFSLFIIYDFNVIKHQNHTKEDVPLLALNLYLDFINLFFDLLRLIGLLSDD